MNFNVSGGTKRMAIKRRLSDLVSDLVPEKKLEVADSQSLEVTKSVTSTLDRQIKDSILFAYEKGVGLSSQPFTTEARLTDLQNTEVSESVTSEVPKYMTFDRKEARLRADQVESLTNLTKALNRKRKGRGERITDNTLIRVAVDLLLSKADVLEGSTEEEIRGVLNIK
jgi:hypothetical protein